MKIKWICWGFISLLWLITSCSNGSNSGGGSNSNGGTGNGGNVPITYANADLKGTWRWNADRQTTPLNMNGTLTFNGELRVVGWENNYCPGQQNFTLAEFWLWADGYVKGHNPALCNFPNTEVKFSMNFVSGTDKKKISGLMDIHGYDPATDTDTYNRFDITMTREGSSSSQQMMNSKTQINVKATKSYR